MMNSDETSHFTALENLLPQSLFRPVGDGYLTEPRGRYSGHAVAVLAPSSLTEVVQVVLAGAKLNLPLVPYGGGTGLVGGQIKGDDPAPILVSMERMNRVRAVFPEEGVLVAEAGAILHDVQTAAGEAGLLYPLSMASEGSCSVGGNLATNAGGVNVLRYGNARAQCLGIEAVLPDGSVWNGLKRLRKDNTGYDLRDLIIGSEGTLGIITAASLRLVARPTSEAVGYISVPNPSAALALLGRTRRHVGEAVSAFELIHSQGLEFLKETMPELRQPFQDDSEWRVLIELGMHGASNAAESLESLFSEAFEHGEATDGLIGQSEAQRSAFWKIRESMPEGNKRVGAIASHDISLPLGALPDFIEKAGVALREIGPFRINCFGHVGDGNLHYNLFPPVGHSKAEYSDRRVEITECVHDLVHAFDGSVSAEHGIGRLKTDDLVRYKDPAQLVAMRAIKHALDPQGIMNPGAVLAEKR